MIPASIFLFIFLFFALVVLLFTFFNVYHMMRFGEARPKTVVITIIYVCVMLTLFAYSTSLLTQADWQATLQIIPDRIIQ